MKTVTIITTWEAEVLTPAPTENWRWTHTIRVKHVSLKKNSALKVITEIINRKKG